MKKRSPSRSRKFVVAINAELHAQLKARAEREGRKMSRMVEDKLGELIAD